MDPLPDAPAEGARTPFVDRRLGRSPFPPIADYAFLSDCHTGALVAPDGMVEWLCPPRFDSPSIFAAILDRGAGGFRLGPTGTGVPAGRRYEPGTNVLETTWMTPTGKSRPSCRASRCSTTGARLPCGVASRTTRCRSTPPTGPSRCA